MPSRPVLIGRGLVPTTYKTTHVTHTPAQTNEHTPSHSAGVMFASTKQFPTNKPDPHMRVRGFVEVERVTAAIAKGKHPAPFRTRKLSLSAPMVLQPRGCGRVGRRRTSFEK